jgi:hypothetical protein
MGAQKLKSRPTLVSDSQPFFRSAYQGPFSETSANLLRAEVRHAEVNAGNVTEACNTCGRTPEVDLENQQHSDAARQLSDGAESEKRKKGVTFVLASAGHGTFALRNPRWRIQSAQERVHVPQGLLAGRTPKPCRAPA